MAKYVSSRKQASEKKDSPSNGGGITIEVTGQNRIGRVYTTASIDEEPQRSSSQNHAVRVVKIGVSKEVAPKLVRSDAGDAAITTPSQVNVLDTTEHTVQPGKRFLRLAR